MLKLAFLTGRIGSAHCESQLQSRGTAYPTWIYIWAVRDGAAPSYQLHLILLLWEVWTAPTYSDTDPRSVGWDGMAAAAAATSAAVTSVQSDRSCLKQPQHYHDTASSSSISGASKQILRSFLMTEKGLYQRCKQRQCYIPLGAEAFCPPKRSQESLSQFQCLKGLQEDKGLDW